MEWLASYMRVMLSQQWRRWLSGCQGSRLAGVGSRPLLNITIELGMLLGRLMGGLVRGSRHPGPRELLDSTRLLGVLLNCKLLHSRPSLKIISDLGMLLGRRKGGLYRRDMLAGVGNKLLLYITCDLGKLLGHLMGGLVRRFRHPGPQVLLDSTRLLGVLLKRKLLHLR